MENLILFSEIGDTSKKHVFERCLEMFLSKFVQLYFHNRYSSKVAAQCIYIIAIELEYRIFVFGCGYGLFIFRIK